MTIDTFAQNTLRELRDKKEINWDYVPRLVEDGKITKEDAMSSLRQCLNTVIPDYRRMAQTGDSRYWGQRLTEAETALTAIDKNKTVKYRGIQL